MVNDVPPKKIVENLFSTLKYIEKIKNYVSHIQQPRPQLHPSRLTEPPMGSQNVTMRTALVAGFVKPLDILDLGALPASWPAPDWWSQSLPSNPLYAKVYGLWGGLAGTVPYIVDFIRLALGMTAGRGPSQGLPWWSWR